MTERRQVALVVRGHTTHDIRGVTEVVDANILTAVTNIRKVVDPTDTLIETSWLTDSRIERYNKDRPNVIYIGGSQLMWSRLQGTVECEVEHDGSWTYTTFKFRPLIKRLLSITTRLGWRSRHEVSTNPGTIDFMVYEHRTRTGDVVTALFGSSPLGTHCAVRRWMNSGFDGTELIIVGEAMKDDPYVTRELYRHEV